MNSTTEYGDQEKDVKLAEEEAKEEDAKEEAEEDNDEEEENSMKPQL